MKRIIQPIIRRQNIIKRNIIKRRFNDILEIHKATGASNDDILYHYATVPEGMFVAGMLNDVPIQYLPQSVQNQVLSLAPQVDISKPAPPAIITQLGYEIPSVVPPVVTPTVTPPVVTPTVTPTVVTPTVTPTVVTPTVNPVVAPVILANPINTFGNTPSFGGGGGDISSDFSSGETVVTSGGYVTMPSGIEFTGYIYPYMFIALTLAGAGLGFFIAHKYKQPMLGKLALIAAGLMGGSAIGMKVKPPVKKIG